MAKKTTKKVEPKKEQPEKVEKKGITAEYVNARVDKLINALKSSKTLKGI